MKEQKFCHQIAVSLGVTGRASNEDSFTHKAASPFLEIVNTWVSR